MARNMGKGIRHPTVPAEIGCTLVGSIGKAVCIVGFQQKLNHPNSFPRAKSPFYNPSL